MYHHYLKPYSDKNRLSELTGSGYITSDQFGGAFPLDSEDEQQVLFLASSKGGVNLDIFYSKGSQAKLTVFPDDPSSR